MVFDRTRTPLTAWVREPKGIGRSRMAVLDDASAGALEPFVTGSIQPGARVITDGWAGYGWSRPSGVRSRTALPWLGPRGAARTPAGRTGA